MGSALTDAQSYALVGGFLGGFFATMGILVIAFYILLVIALWKIFEKAGEAGWKSLIPIYNLYVMCKIIGASFWISLIVLPIVVGIVGTLLFNDNKQAIDLISAIYSMVVDIYLSSKLAKAFGKGVGYTLGLILLPNIFQLILGFGSAEYQGTSK